MRGIHVLRKTSAFLLNSRCAVPVITYLSNVGNHCWFQLSKMHFFAMHDIMPILFSYKFSTFPEDVHNWSHICFTSVTSMWYSDKVGWDTCCAKICSFVLLFCYKIIRWKHSYIVPHWSSSKLTQDNLCKWCMGRIMMV